MKVLWFSRHQLSKEQIADLQKLYGTICITQVNKTIQDASEINHLIQKADIVAVVAPLPLQAQFLKLAEFRPVLISRNHRVEEEDGSVSFHHAGWSRLRKVEVVIDELSSIPAPENSIR